MSARPLLLPVETLNREFDGKLLLALHAAERGWQPIIGERTALHARLQNFPPSVYFSKGFKPGTAPINRIIDGLGHAIVGLDEESLVNVSDDMVLLRMDPEILRRIRMTFAWGANDARVFGRVDGLKHKPIIPTGNPRMDLLRPELDGFYAEEAARLRHRYGRFALFNTNFSMVNHFMENRTQFRAASWAPAERVEEMRSGLLGHKTNLLDAFLELLPRLAGALKPDALVIRPHPSENWQVWYDAAEGRDNVHVVHDGSVGPWLAAADVLIHNGCTSAVEAAIIGTPALSFRPVKSPGFDNDLPNGLSLEFEDGDALAAEAAAIVRRRSNARHQLDPTRQALLDAHVNALSGPLACARLLDEIECNADILGPDASLSARAVTRLRCLIRQLRRTYRSFSGPSAKTLGKPEYMRHKFPGISRDGIDRRIARFQAALGRFDGLSAEEIVPDLFRIRAG
jgi:surface carbohydrate biosynthesis protein